MGSNEIKKEKLLEKDNQAFSKAAKSIGFKFIKGDEENWPVVYREYKGFDIVMVRYDKDSLQIKAKFTSHVMEWMYIRSKKGSPLLESTRNLHKITSGDRAFDEQFLMYGSTPYILFSYLNKRIRKLVTAAAEDAIIAEFKKDTVSLLLPDSICEDQSKLKNLINNIVKITEEFSSKTGVREKLIENCKNEDNPEVICKIMNHLVEWFYNDESVYNALDQVIDDTDSVMVQIEAARHLGENGIFHLLKILSERKDLNNNDKIAMLELFERENAREKNDAPVLYNNNKKLIIATANAFHVFTEDCAYEFAARLYEPGENDICLETVILLGQYGEEESIKYLKAIQKATKNTEILKAVKCSKKEIDLRCSKIKGTQIKEEQDNSNKDGEIDNDKDTQSGPEKVAN